MKNTNINIPLIESYFKQPKKLKVLDIGAGDCSEAFDFYDKSNLEFDSITCVDSGKDVLLKPHMEINSLYASTVGYKRNNPNDIFSYVKSDGLDFLLSCNDSFDLIIFSQFLHFFKHTKKENYLFTSRSLLNAGGIIFIKVANTLHDHNLKRNLPVFDEDLISHLNFTFDIDFIEEQGKFYEIIITDTQSKYLELP